MRIFVLLLMTLSVANTGPSIPQGEYVYEGGRGTLRVEGEPNKGQVFVIKTLGDKAQRCSLEGTLRGMEGQVGDRKSPDLCTVELEPESGGVQISAITEETCRALCGPTASFEGRYVKPVPECGPVPLKSARAEAKVKSTAKEYGSAKALLSRLVDRCETVIDPFELMWIRNDLAVAQHHDGDDAGCIATLKALLALLAPDGETPEERGVGDPAYSQMVQQLAQATRANLTLCREAKPPAPAPPR